MDQTSQNVNVNVNNATPIPISDKSRLVTLLFSIFLGELGIHRFYTGKIGTGILWLFTCGLFGIGYLIDIIMIACGTYKDKYGRFVKNW